jgi:hypothetical protein
MASKKIKNAQDGESLTAKVGDFFARALNLSIGHLNTRCPSRTFSADDYVVTSGYSPRSVEIPSKKAREQYQSRPYHLAAKAYGDGSAVQLTKHGFSAGDVTRVWINPRVSSARAILVYLTAAIVRATVPPEPKARYKTGGEWFNRFPKAYDELMALVGLEGDDHKPIDNADGRGCIRPTVLSEESKHIPGDAAFDDLAEALGAFPIGAVDEYKVPAEDKSRLLLVGCFGDGMETNSDGETIPHFKMRVKPSLLPIIVEASGEYDHQNIGTWNCPACILKSLAEKPTDTTIRPLILLEPDKVGLKLKKEETIEEETKEELAPTGTDS